MAKSDLKLFSRQNEYRTPLFYCRFVCLNKIQITYIFYRKSCIVWSLPRKKWLLYPTSLKGTLRNWWDTFLWNQMLKPKITWKNWRSNTWPSKKITEWQRARKGQIGADMFLKGTLRNWPEITWSSHVVRAGLSCLGAKMNCVEQT